MIVEIYILRMTNMSNRNDGDAHCKDFLAHRRDISIFQRTNEYENRRDRKLMANQSSSQLEEVRKKLFPLTRFRAVDRFLVTSFDYLH